MGMTHRWRGAIAAAVMAVVVSCGGGTGSDAVDSGAAPDAAGSDGGETGRDAAADGTAPLDAASDVGSDVGPATDDTPGGDDGGDAPPDVLPTGPPVVCRPGVAGFEGPPFVDVSEETGLRALAVDGTKLTAADVDGDGWPDLVVHGPDNRARDNYRLLLNRPAEPGTPGVAAGARVFVDASEAWDFRQSPNPAVAGRQSSFSNFVDLDNDGDLDLLSATTHVFDYRQMTYHDEGDRNEVLLNEGDRFALVEGHGLAVPPDVYSGTWSPSFAEPTPWATAGFAVYDHDRDGILDVFVANWYHAYGVSSIGQQDHLYRGRGDGTFEDVTEAAGLLQRVTAATSWRDVPKPDYGVSHCDVNDDGRQDIVVPSYGRQFNDLWIAQEDGTYWNIAEAFDVDGDDGHDFTDNQMYRCWCSTQPGCDAPAPMMNCESAGWTPATDENEFRLNGNTFGAYCADVDEDGDLDVLLTETAHWWAGSSSDRTQLLLNRGPNGLYHFERPPMADLGLDRTYSAVDWNEGDHFFLWTDYDNDGRWDAYFTPSAYPDQFGRLYHQRPDGTFELVTTDGEGLGDHDSEVAVALDYDRDGDLDLVVGHVAARGHASAFVSLFRNDVGHRNNALQLTLVGAGAGAANRDAIGARVLVHVGDRVLRRDVEGPFGRFGQQNPFVLTIGLEDACVADRVEIRWPDATLSESVFTDVRANYDARIEQAGERLVYEGVDD